MKHLPELLCPAGSPLALDAAIEGGADAVYLGGAAFNARMNAHNFGGDALRSAVLRAHSYGVKVYLTLNTLVGDRELSAFVKAAEDAARAGVDALIIADLGGAAAVHRAIPTLELHASTQMSGHNSLSAKELQDFGFSRIVLARETCARDLFETVKNSPLEIEYFIHGALCVSHSGQCLFSSLVGGRSGNRGECAQPCRLPYACAGCKQKGEKYPLSLKDLTLASHVPELIDSGVASLKIEGRMKSPEYVLCVTRIWRKLLDEHRAATPEEMRVLSDAFSRGGFTDGYWNEKLDRRMLGVRSEDDKGVSRTLEPFRGLMRKLPLHLDAVIQKSTPMQLTVSDGERSVTVTGAVPEVAINAPLCRDTVERNLSKLGGTAYMPSKLTVRLDEGLMLPISQLNALRRSAIEAWEAGQATQKEHTFCTYVPQKAVKARQTLRTARFYDAKQITPLARSYFDHIYLPLGKETDESDGVILPAVIFESDIERIEQQLLSAKSKGIERVLIGNLGHIEPVRRAGMRPIGDFRLNVTNTETVLRLSDLGIGSVILSPELTLPQARDIGGDTSLIVYGRIPLMTLEKCVIRELSSCEVCRENHAAMTDRRGFTFPILREWEHRNVIYNSLPTGMSDREAELTRAGITNRHFIFSVETPEEVDRIICAYRAGKPIGESVRRI